MRIMIDARFYGLENAGLGRYAMNLVSELVKIDNQNQYLILLRRKYYDELKLPKNWQKVLADFKHYSLDEQIKLPRLIHKYEPDLVHFLHFNVPFLFNGKYVVTIHDMIMHKQTGREATTLSPSLYFVKRLAYKQVFAHAIKASVGIIVPSEFVKKEVVDYFKIPEEKVEVTYEGISFASHEKFENLRSCKTSWPDLSNFPHAQLKFPYFLYVGNAYPHKNLERAIKAARNLKTNFYIVSSRNVFTKRLEKVIKKNNAGHFVKLLGFVPDKELQELHKNSLGFVYPSTYEGFGLPGLEAMKAGTLVLASDIPVFKEIYQDNVIYFEPKDLESMQKAMSRAMEMKKETRQKMIGKAKDFTRKYSWEKMATETLEVYESIF